jgi:hypothetical protein
MASDLEQLIEFGFEEAKAKLALKKTGGRMYCPLFSFSSQTNIDKVQQALDWLEKNADKSIEDITAEDAEAASSEMPELKVGEEAKSLVCNDCGKKFRSVAQAEWHASKTQHQDFAESTEEIKPLTEEEKKAKLEELKQKLAEKRSKESEQEKIERKNNEKIRMKSTKEGADIKENLMKAEQIKEAEKKRREKKEDERVKQKILAQIAADKEDRKRKAEMEKAQRAGTYTMPLETVSAPSAPKAAADYKETRLRLTTPNGTFTKSFPVETTLFEVAHAIAEENGTEVTSFTQNFPKKIFDAADFGQSLKEAGMVPSSALIVK